MNYQPTDILSGERKILGEVWDNQTNKFLFQIKMIVDTSDDFCVRKRSVLKTLAAFYNPLELIQLLIIVMNVFFKDCENLE